MNAAIFARDSTTNPMSGRLPLFEKPQYVGIEWDGEDRLITVILGNNRSEFTYDGRGQRVRRIEKSGGVVTAEYRYLWCNAAICEERDSSGSTVLKRFFTQGMQSGTTPFYYSHDQIGSIRELVDSSQVLRARYSYDLYGNATKISGDVDSLFQFTGHFFHAESGLLFALHRAYDAATARWLSEDPAGVDGLGNAYAYARNNPVSFIDPFGLVEVEKRIKVQGAVDTDPFCGENAGACFRPGNEFGGAYVTHVCECNNGSYKLKFTLHVIGTIFVYNGPFPYKGRSNTKDPTVKDRASAIQHEHSWHIDPAIEAAKKILQPAEDEAYGSEDECHDAANKVIPIALAEFKSILDKTQEDENSK